MSLCSATWFGFSGVVSGVSLPSLLTSVEVSSSKATAASTGSVTSSFTVMVTGSLPSDFFGVKVFSPLPRTVLPSALEMSSAFRVYSFSGTRPS